MLEFRNTPRENGVSPAEMVFGHPLRSIIPAHRSSYAARWRTVMEGRDRQGRRRGQVPVRRTRTASGPTSFGDPRTDLEPQIQVMGQDGSHCQRRALSLLPRQIRKWERLMAKPPIPTPNDRRHASRRRRNRRWRKSGYRRQHRGS
jgi:hypothetical protein